MFVFLLYFSAGENEHRAAGAVHPGLGGESDHGRLRVQVTGRGRQLLRTLPQQ